LEKCFRSDLADELIERIDKEEYGVENRKYKNISISKINILKDNNSLNKKVGTYVSIAFNNLEDKQNRDDIKEVLVANLKEFIDDLNLKKDDKVLVVGLGNEDFSADALGPMAAKEVVVTSHLFTIEDFEIKEGTRQVSLLTPGVMGQTGLETADIVKSVCDFYKPRVVIFIDALATKNMNRINKVIQVTNTGIAPGSGIGNNRKALEKEYLGCDCICIGVATVVGVSSIVYETINMIEKMYGEIPSVYSPLKEENRYHIISTILDEDEGEMIVTPKQIDEDIRNISYIIGNSINESLHKCDNLL
jgi:spore protease